MRVTKLVYGEGWTKNIGKHEKPVHIYNEVEYIINPEDVIKDIHIKLRDTVTKLNQEELDKYLEP